MSKIKLRLPLAQALAGKVTAALEPGCLRCEVAGSIRRAKAEVGDIEIVCIPRPIVDLFGDPIGSLLDRILATLAEEGRLIRGDKNGQKYKTFFIPSVPGLKLDLFITTPECWGVNFTIRTGPAEFSQQIVTQKNKGGLLPSDLNVAGARVWRGAEVLATPEEKDFFELVGGPGWWLEPGERG